MQYLTHQWIWKILTFHLNLLILKLLGSKSDAFLLVYSQGLTVIALPPDHPDRPDCSTDRKLGKYFLNPRKKDTDQDEIEEKLIPVKVTVPDEPVRKVSPWLIVHCSEDDSSIWLIRLSERWKCKKSWGCRRCCCKCFVSITYFGWWRCWNWYWRQWKQNWRRRNSFESIQQIHEFHISINH